MGQNRRAIDAVSAYISALLLAEKFERERPRARQRQRRRTNKATWKAFGKVQKKSFLWLWWGS